MSDKKNLDHLNSSFNEWEENKVEKLLDKFPERKNIFSTGSDKEVERLYTPLQVEGMDYERDLGFPGQYPYTRGVQPTM